MKMSKQIQHAGELLIKYQSPRMSAEKRAEIIDLMAQLKDLLKVNHKVEDLQIVFTGAKSETTVVINSEE